MDQVTQSNAANSEESASAAEELSAQAEEMQRMVRDLVAMVGGANGKHTVLANRTLSGVQIQHAAATSGPVARLGAPQKRLQKRSEAQAHGNAGHAGARLEQRRAEVPVHAGGGHTVVRPEEIIPLNDEDLQDF